MTLSASVIKNYQKELDKASGVSEHDAILAKAIAYLSGATPADLPVLESVVGATGGELSHVIKRLIAFLKNTPLANFAQMKLVWNPDAPSHDFPARRRGQWSLIAM